MACNQHKLLHYSLFVCVSYLQDDYSIMDTLITWSYCLHNKMRQSYPETGFSKGFTWENLKKKKHIITRKDRYTHFPARMHYCCFFGMFFFFK
jgi:hypothetical protein